MAALYGAMPSFKRKNLTKVFLMVYLIQRGLKNDSTNAQNIKAGFFI
jgi:hypothetical protein